MPSTLVFQNLVALLHALSLDQVPRKVVYVRNNSLRQSKLIESIVWELCSIEGIHIQAIDSWTSDFEIHKMENLLIDQSLLPSIRNHRVDMPPNSALLIYAADALMAGVFTPAQILRPRLLKTTILFRRELALPYIDSVITPWGFGRTEKFMHYKNIATIQKRWFYYCKLLNKIVNSQSALFEIPSRPLLILGLAEPISHSYLQNILKEARQALEIWPELAPMPKLHPALRLESRMRTSLVKFIRTFNYSYSFTASEAHSATPLELILASHPENRYLGCYTGGIVNTRPNQVTLVPPPRKSAERWVVDMYIPFLQTWKHNDIWC